MLRVWSSDTKYECMVWSARRPLSMLIGVRDVFWDVPCTSMGGLSGVNGHSWSLQFVLLYPSDSTLSNCLHDVRDHLAVLAYPLLRLYRV